MYVVSYYESTLSHYRTFFTIFNDGNLTNKTRYRRSGFGRQRREDEAETRRQRHCQGSRHALFCRNSGLPNSGSSHYVSSINEGL